MVATTAPIVGSLALWAVTHSPYVLVFALLGPLVAVASLGDSAIQGRRALRRGRRRFAADVAAAHEAIERGHTAERARLTAVHRDLRSLMSAPRRDPERWRGGMDHELPVVVGVGQLVSTLVLEDADTPAGISQPDEFAARLDSLQASAAILRAAPVVVDARLGIGVCGTPVLATAVARGIILQLATALSPENHEIVIPRGWESNWLKALPHTVVEAASSPVAVVFRHRERAARRTSSVASIAASPRAIDAVTIAVAKSTESLPRECRTVLRVEGASSSEILPRPTMVAEGSVVPEFVSREQASVFAALLAGAAEADGLVHPGGGLPDSVDFSSLCAGHDDSDPTAAKHSTLAPSHARDSLACTPAQGLTGPLEIDLVRHGPHAIIGGTTGSGKSELLVAWVLAMAARCGPQLVTFLLVDFKGGSSFQAVQHLPHSVGLITDLDEHSARRALTSLRAELRYRERTLTEAGARSIEQLPPEYPLARLVIVVDEFAAMVQDFPELHELFADIAARGRSLGVHLILCTQRPAGVVRDAVLANCTLRISLRVNNAADSTAVIGTGAAAELPRIPVGRALICLGGDEPEAVQIALALDADVRLVEERWRPSGGEAVGQPRRPWCDPLPPRIRLGEVPGYAQGSELVFGLVDLPQEQRMEPARYSPHRDGSLVVIGGHRSGKSGLLATILAAGEASVDRGETVIPVPSDHEGAWDVVTGQLDAIRTGTSTPALLLIDDLDALIGSLPEEYAFAFAEIVSALLREGGRVGIHLVITARRLGSSIQSIAVLCDSRLLLRLPNKQEHVAAGGEVAEFDAALTAGGGYWRGNRVQVALAPESATRDGRNGSKTVAVHSGWEHWHGWIVVTARPAELSRRLNAGLAAGERTASVPRGWEVVCLDGRPTAALTVTAAAQGRVLIADVETWQSQWGLLAALKTSMPLVFDGCGTAEFRALTRERRLPPLIASASAAVWILTPDGTLERTLPPWAESDSPHRLE